MIRRLYTFSLAVAAFAVLVPLAGCQDETPPPKPVQLSPEDKALAERVRQEQANRKR